MTDLKSVDAVIIELHDNPLTERQDDHYGRVVNLASVSSDTLIERAISNGFSGNAANMHATIAAVDAEALKAIVRGEIVSYALGHVAIDVEGAFIGDSPAWDPTAHRLVARITPAKRLRETLKTVPVRIRGMAPDSSSINTVTDVATGEANKRLTPGGMVNLRGTRIKIVGTAEGVGLWLTNQDSQEAVKIPMTSIGVNDPSKMSFVVPASLPTGNYLLSIVTLYSGGGAPLKEPRTTTLSYVLVVDQNT